MAAAHETAPGHTIATAGTLATGDEGSGGGGPVDFWKMTLHGGDKVQFTVNNPGNNYYDFQLYAPGTTDDNFPNATAVTGTSTAYYNTQTIITLQAPYNGTFFLAVCQNAANSNCVSTTQQSGTNPMNPYTFSTVFTGGPATTTSLKLSSGSVTYANEKSLKFSATVKGLFDGTPSGKVVITGGGKTLCTIAKLSGGKGTCSPASGTLLSSGKYALTATYRGNLASSTGTAPLTVVPNHRTSTALKLSATTITDGHEKSLKLTATAKALYGGTFTGKIVITEGSKTICTITKLVKGGGTCSPASNTLLRAGKYSVVATYSGNYLGSKSKAVTLTVKP